MCALFAATYPERTSALIMLNSYARLKPAPDHPFGRTPEALEALVRACRDEWGGPIGLDQRAPSFAHLEHERRWWARFLRMSTSPAAIIALLRMNYEIDIRQVLPVVRVPTLVMHGDRDTLIDPSGGRRTAELIPGARYVEIEGMGHDYPAAVWDRWVAIWSEFARDHS